VSLLEVRRVSKRFGGLQALSGVDCEIAGGEIVGLIGPNGAGKSTLLNTITGVYPTDGGTIRFDGHDLAGLPPDRITRLGIGRTFQIPQPLGSLSCLDNVAVAALFGGRAAGVEAAADEARAILDFVGLSGKAPLPPQSLTIVDLRRLELARALATGARLLLLDEINTGLTASEITEAIRLIRRVRDRGTAILMVEHLVRLIMSVCDRVVVLDFGRKIAEGTPDEVGRNPEVIRAYLGQQRGGADARG
jgi:branched-chain amino acid transport system ATP-binding protein